MKKIRPLLFIFVQLLVLQLGFFRWSFGVGFDSPTTTALGSMGGCGGVHSLGSELTGDTSTDSDASLITGTPVGIPAPIAKAFDGVDPQSLQFTAGSQNSVSTGGLRALTTARAVTISGIGTLTGSVLDQTGAEKIVALVVDDVVQSTALTSNYDFSFSISADLADTSLGLVVLSSDSTADNIVSVSEPVVATISSPDDVIDDYQLVVGITNLSVSTSGVSTAVGDIATHGLAFAKDGTIAFVSTASDGTFNLHTVSQNGGAYADLATGVTIAPSLMQYVGSVFYDVQSTTGLIRSITASGSITNETSSAITPSLNRHIAFSPSGNYIARNVLDVNNGSMLLGVSAIGSTTVFSIPITLPEPLVKTMTFDWADESKIIVIKGYADSTFSAQLYDVSATLAGNNAAVVPTVVIASTLVPMLRPDIDPSKTNFFIENCKPLPDIFMDLCVVDNAGTRTKIISGSFNVTNARYSDDGSFIVFDGHFGSLTDASTSRVGIYNVATTTTTFVAKGLHPIMSPTNNKIIAYLSLDSTGALQTSILNLDNLSLP